LRKLLSRSPQKKQKIPNFESGIIEEPLLAFGGQHRHVDPKTGLALYGPYSLLDQPRPTLRSINVGIVGPASMVSDAKAWLKACQGMLTNDGSQPFLYPHYPGFNELQPFQCDLVYGDTWSEVIKDREMKSALSEDDFYTRVKKVIQLYTKSIEILSNREPRPDVTLCCIPQDVIKTCTVQKYKKSKPKSNSKKRQGISNGQLSIFTQLVNDDDDWGYQNLRRGLKAEAMQYGMPTQLVWPSTLSTTGASTSATGGSRTQDIATRAWNFTTALYHKAGGSPWRLADLDPGTCFVGISFYKEILSDNPRMRTSMAQAFTAAGDGYVLRGNTFDWNERDGRSPHLDKGMAFGLLNNVIELYKLQNQGSLPTRIVVHKSSKFWSDELEGLEKACEFVPRRDFIALGSRGLQFYRPGLYPPLRGTYVKFSDSDLLLYTSGYIPFLKTYPGARAPLPLEVLEHIGDSPWDLILRDILSLTKMNWNTADFSCGVPITIAFSRKVGQILAEVSPNSRIRPEYRFYM